MQTDLQRSQFALRIVQGTSAIRRLRLTSRGPAWGLGQSCFGGGESAIVSADDLESVVDRADDERMSLVETFDHLSRKLCYNILSNE